MSDIDKLIEHMNERSNLIEQLCANEATESGDVQREIQDDIAALKSISEERDALREALTPFSYLVVPSNPKGNSGIYTLFHKHIKQARKLLGETQ